MILIIFAPLSVHHSIVVSITSDILFVKYYLINPKFYKNKNFLKKLLTNKTGMGIIHIVRLKQTGTCTSGSVVEYRLAKARVAGSNPVSCFFCAPNEAQKTLQINRQMLYWQQLNDGLIEVQIL